MKLIITKPGQLWRFELREGDGPDDQVRLLDTSLSSSRWVLMRMAWGAWRRHGGPR